MTTSEPLTRAETQDLARSCGPDMEVFAAQRTAGLPGSDGLPVPRHTLFRVELMRSMLFVPGDSPRKFDKARQGAADALILDLTRRAAGLRPRERARHAAHAR